MARKKVSPELSAYFRAIGKKGAAKSASKGASKGGKRSLETMTPEARVARAKKAAAASAKARRKKGTKGK